MKNRKLLLFAFITVALVQLFVPSKMIWDREYILKAGKEYKFETAPIDPSDPFRGKYITLRFKENYIFSGESEWKKADVCFVSFKINAEGFAEIDKISETEPDHDNFIKTKIQHIYNGKLFVNYPFKRYYMEESKAYEAEVSYRESQSDTNMSCYALVSVKYGDAVLKDVFINNTPIVKFVKDRQKRN